MAVGAVLVLTAAVAVTVEPVSATLTTSLSAGAGALSLDIDVTTGSFQLGVDGASWISGGGLPPMANLTVTGTVNTTGTDPHGTFKATTLQWASMHGRPVTLETEFKAYSETQLLVLTQRFPQGYTTAPPPPPTPPPPPPPPAELCSHVLSHTDQSGGSMIDKLPFTSNEDCCGACINNTKCDAWVVSLYPTNNSCFLIQGHKGTRPVGDRSMGIVRGAGPTPETTRFIAAFPTLASKSTATLGYIGWGGCQVKDPQIGTWTGTQSFDGVVSGEPIVLHTYTARPRAVVIAPMGNFFVSGQATQSTGVLECGIRTTVTELPKGFEHSTAIVGSTGINATLVALGDLLLDLGNKTRTDPYQDFVLSHLGYWTDNGAYYYHESGNFTTPEDALKAVKADFIARDIPSRYTQWDDWWMEGDGDVPGITSWTPIPSKFPSGFTDWLGEPLSMYAPMYSAHNDWIDSYEWRIDPFLKLSAIPLDPKFYLDLFTNGSKIGQKMFEQDFMCTINAGTSLTNADLTSGNTWVAGMNAAAVATNNTLQWCMMNPCHALASTTVPRMTNGRATGDNCRGSPTNIESMGLNGMLYYALGFFASRDNVWTTPPEVTQTGCNRYCSEPNRHADNAIAFLGGGPYGPSDAIGMTDKSVVMYACRSDGVLLRPSWPLGTLDVTYSTMPVQGNTPPLVWAAHDDHALGEWRWSYVMSVNLAQAYTLHAADLQGLNPGAVGIYNVSLGASITSVVRVPAGGAFALPASPALKDGPGVAHMTVAPVLPSGMILLGDVGKWATMSLRRFDQLTTTATSTTARVRGAPNESVSVTYVPAGSSTTQSVTCTLAKAGTSSCAEPDMHGDTDCFTTLTCTPSTCTCSA